MYSEANTVTSIITKFAQQQNNDQLLRQTYDLAIEFNQKAPKQIKYVEGYTASTNSAEPGFLFISNYKDGQKQITKMNLDQARQFINNGFK